VASRLPARPRINAGGRIGEAGLGARLLTCREPAEAERHAATLDGLNRDRQALEGVASRGGRGARPHGAGAAAAGADPRPWLARLASGIVGLVAARLRERFCRPAFAFAVRPDGSATGSGRSVPGVDLGRLVRASVEAGIAAKGGGHAMAAGATILAEDLDRFRESLEAGLGSAPSVECGDALEIDGALSAGGLTPDFVRALERAGPFGQGQPEPVFAFGSHRVVEAREVGSCHVRVVLKAGDGRTLKGMAFRAADRPLGRMLLESCGETVHVAGTLSIDCWGGGERVALRILDAARP
jgi:single-stranded-DNA-specific exonuclease